MTLFGANRRRTPIGLTARVSAGRGERYAPFRAPATLPSPMTLRVPPPFRLHPALAWALAAAAPLLVVALELQLWPHILLAPFILFFPVILVIAYLGGLAPGLGAVATSVVLVNALILGRQPTSVGPAALASSLFVIVSFVLAVAAAALRDGYAALRDTEERFRTLVETIPQLVFTAHPNGASDFYGAQTLAYSGLSAAELRRSGWTAMLHPDDRARAIAVWKTAIAAGVPATDELRLRRSDGAYRWFLVSAVPLRSADGRVLKWFGSCTDIQAQKESEEAKTEAIAARDVFLSVASHELKTPIAAALLQIQQARRRLARAPADVAGASERAAATEASIERLGKLVEALLDVSRVATGRLVLERAPYDLSAAVQNTCARFADAARRSASPLALEVEPGIRADGDRLRTEQVLTNLLSNALKYGAGRPIAVTLRRDAGRAVLTVQDHGIGIDPEDQARVFDRFERAASARHYGGLGLGLWIARQIVEASAGVIRVESWPGAGSTFTVELPAAEAHPALEAAAAR